MIRPLRFAIAAASLVLAGGFTAANAAPVFDSTVPSRYVQMNSPGDGISSGARSTGNARIGRRAKRVRHWHHRRHHRHFHHRRHR